MSASPSTTPNASTPVAVRLVPRHGRPGHRRQPRDKPSVDYATLHRTRAAGRHHELRRVKPVFELTYFAALYRPAVDRPVRPRRAAGSILNLTATPRTLIRPGPRAGDPKTCTPGLPAPVPQVNTVFEVARQAASTVVGKSPGLRDPQAARPATGIQDLFTPEINSQCRGGPAGGDWTTDKPGNPPVRLLQVIAAPQRRYRRLGPTPHHRVGTPAIFGMNFHTSPPAKLPTSTA